MDKCIRCRDNYDCCDLAVYPIYHHRDVISVGKRISNRDNYARTHTYIYTKGDDQRDVISVGKSISYRDNYGVLKCI